MWHEGAFYNRSETPVPPVRLTTAGTKGLDFDGHSGHNPMLDLDSGIGLGNMRKRAWLKTVMGRFPGIFWNGAYPFST
jgi:hypothetical protein